MTDLNKQDETSSTTLTKAQQETLEAAAFRQLLRHLDNNKQVQNIDLMILADFCRNCLSKWYLQAANEQNIEMTDAEAREHIYKMPYAQWKEHHQLPATEAQMKAFNERAASKQK